MGPQNKRILIVDDTQENIQILGTVLKQQGFLVTVALNGKQAVESALKAAPDLILLDITMPVMDGFEACRLLKSDEKTRDIPVIFLTARADPADVTTGFEMGGVDYITKPFNTTELLQRVATHLDMHDLQIRLEERVEELGDAVATISRMARENESLLRHELANAIAPLVGYVEVLSDETGIDAALRRKTVNKVSVAVSRLAALFEALRDLQAIEYGKKTLSRQKIDIMALLQQEIRQVEESAGGDTTVDLRSRFSDSFIQADPSFMPGVFRNLIKNAVEHVRELPSHEQRLSVVLAEVEGGLSVVVANGGPPIPEERLAHFFEKFNSTKKEAGGTGLGTSYANTVVQAHGGRIDVRSSADEGTRVRVWLPRGAAEDDAVV